MEDTRFGWSLPSLDGDVVSFDKLLVEHDFVLLVFLRHLG